MAGLTHAAVVVVADDPAFPVGTDEWNANHLFTGGAQHQVLFQGASNVLSTSAGLTWNDSTKVLTVIDGSSTTPPAGTLLAVQGPATTRIFLRTSDASGYAVFSLGNDTQSNAGGFFMTGSTNTAYGGVTSFNIGTFVNTALAFVTNDAVRMTLTGLGMFGIGTATPPALFSLAPPSLSGTPSTIGSYFNGATATFTDNNTAGSGTAASFAAYAFQAPTLAATNASVTTTNAATVYISGPPIAGTNETITNPWALQIAAGNVAIGGLLRFNGTNSTGAGTALLSTNSPAVTNSAPYTWISAIAADGSAVFIPCWK